MASATLTPIAKPTPDFVQVQLTEAGIAAANGGSLGISTGRRSFSFVAGVPQKIELSYEWKALLSKQRDLAGNLLLEIVPTAPVAPDAPDAAASSKAKPSPVAPIVKGPIVLQPAPAPDPPVEEPTLPGAPSKL